jgi:hypothetical protein
MNHGRELCTRVTKRQRDKREPETRKERKERLKKQASFLEQDNDPAMHVPSAGGYSRSVLNMETLQDLIPLKPFQL